MKRKWFTIPELLVTVTIIAVLFTIAFIAYGWYNSGARDTKRLEQIENIKKGVELYYLKASKYPDTTNGIVISYSWAELWKQGEFWDDSVRITWKLFWSFKDPKYNINYTYSVTANKKEYQIWAQFEWEKAIAYNPLFETAFAAAEKVKLFWNYNWLIAYTKTWSYSYILVAPSIITSDITYTNWSQIATSKKFSYSDLWWSPSSYKGTSWYQSNWLNLTITNPIIYSWATQDLWKYTNIKLIDSSLRSIYSWSIIASKNSDFLSSTGTSYVKNILAEEIWINPIQPYYCKEILDAWQSTGSWYYTVDSDWAGWSDSYEVYCDMSTSWGGWTRIGDNQIERWDFNNWFDSPNWKESIYNRENTIVAIQNPVESWYALNQHSVSWYNTNNNYGDIRYLLVPNDISVFKKDYEIRLSAWVADAWNQWENSNGWVWYIFENVLNYTDGTSRTNGTKETLDTKVVWWKTWKLQRVRIPITKNVSNFSWSAGKWTETWLAKNFYMTDMKIEVYYK